MALFLEKESQMGRIYFIFWGEGEGCTVKTPASSPVPKSCRPVRAFHYFWLSKENEKPADSKEGAAAAAADPPTPRAIPAALPAHVCLYITKYTLR